MRIFVTGSSGRVGKILVEELVQRGYEVTGFDLKDSGQNREGFTFIKGSLENAVLLKTNLRNQDAIIHLGAYMSWNDAETKRVFSCNVEGTFNLLEGADKKRLQKFIFISTGEVYPEGNPQYLPVDEQHPTRPMSLYGTSKLMGEELVRYHTRRHSLPSVILRISHTQDAAELLDPASFFSGPRFFLKPKIARSRELGKNADLDVLLPLDTGPEKLVLPYGSDGRPYMMHITDTRDTARGILLALESKTIPGDVFNIGSDEPVRFDRSIPEMGKLTGLEVVEARLPGAAVYYATSNRKARFHLGFRPEWDFSKMLTEAAAARPGRKQ